METINKRAAVLKSADPRIDSPLVKVVYPSQAITKEASLTTEPAASGSVAVPTTTQPQVITVVAAPVQKSVETTTPPPATTSQSIGKWLKENAGMLTVVGLLLLAFMYVINKNKV